MVPVFIVSEALSQFFGIISFLCWIFVFIPQLYENYRTGSSEALALGLIYIWVAADILSLVGAVMERLVPMIVVIAFYYLLMDILLLFQVNYYAKAPDTGELPFGARERSPLLRVPSLEAVSAWSWRSRAPTLKKDVYQPWIAFSFITFVTLVASGWAARLYFGEGLTQYGKIPTLCGWASGILYVGSRIPQILKNHTARSCEGLSVYMFLLSVVGNTAYFFAIVFHSTDRVYLLTNLPWIVGSLGTLAMDAFIFFQFYIYQQRPRHHAPILA